VRDDSLRGVVLVAIYYTTRYITIDRRSSTSVYYYWHRGPILHTVSINTLTLNKCCMGVDSDGSDRWHTHRQLARVSAAERRGAAACNHYDVSVTATWAMLTTNWHQQYVAHLTGALHTVASRRYTCNSDRVPAWLMTSDSGKLLQLRYPSLPMLK